MFGDPAVFHHDDPVRDLRVGRLVGDHDGDAVGGDGLDLFEDGVLAAGIEGYL